MDDLKRPVVGVHTQALSQQDRSSSAASSLSLPLHSRISLHKPSHDDYKSLTLARLERDSARALPRRILNPWIPATGWSLRKPRVLRVPSFPGRVREAASTSLESESANRRVRPTWCSTRAVTSAGCSAHPAPTAISKPTPSSSRLPRIPSRLSRAKTNGASPSTCSKCRNDTCLYEVAYGDGSYTVGDFVTETISIGGVSAKDIAIGCGHTNEGLFIGASGLLGLGGGSLSFPSQLNATSFSYCLVDRDSDSASTLEFNSPLHPNAVTARYAVTLSSTRGELLPIPESAFQIDDSGNGGIIIDSGTAVTRLQTDTYNALRDAFVKGTKDLTSTQGAALFDVCYDLSSKKSVEVPTVSFHFADGKVLPLPAKNYLIPIDSEGTFCFAFAPTPSSLSIIGNVQQQGTRVGFDIANSVVGFFPNQC
ncbi:protein ASPARTIC PROTEASE IN GUARD CELL 1 [Prunus yedoensis var. nudiflora]|uniref:Protein ASPARTIC PROTEASE IN GUARD CELL 1 n=1 Tax=Prunus yedoensis var. nudiflora TaxID=2094558 RepID=A0A314YT49_PRUYE|nr:protein ASPARTIC PROTEASE IN GUARD CELL 1 [Prunus yedoensis var. nudiflora]